MNKLGIGLLASSLLLGAGAAAGAETAEQRTTPLNGLLNNEGRLMLQVAGLAGSGEFGEDNGAAARASFRAPEAVLVMPDGSVIVADSKNHLIRRIQGGQVYTLAGFTADRSSLGFPVGGLLDGQGESSVFNRPAALAADSRSNVYVADADNNAIRRISPSGAVTTLAGNGVWGHQDGPGKDAMFHSPQGIAATADGTVYVADTLNHVIRKVTPQGEVTTLNASPERTVELAPGVIEFAGDYRDGKLEEALFNEPTGLALDAKGNLYVSDSGNQLIRYVDLADGVVTTVAGGGDAGAYAADALYAAGDYADGPALQARFDFPRGLAVTAEGGLLIADSLNHAVRYLLDGQVTTLVGSVFAEPGMNNGIESGAQLHLPTDVKVAANGSLLIADSFSNRVRVASPYKLPALPDDLIKVVYGQQFIAFDAKPEFANSRTMVPVRAIAEALGFQVSFDDSKAAVSLGKGSLTIELYTDRAELRRIDGAAEELRSIDVIPYIQDERTYVPVRFFAEEIGLDVQWDPVTFTVVLRNKE